MERHRRNECDYREICFWYGLPGIPSIKDEPLNSLKIGSSKNNAVKFYMDEEVTFAELEDMCWQGKIMYSAKIIQLSQAKED